MLDSDLPSIPNMKFVLLQVPAAPLAGPLLPEEAAPAAAGAPGGRPARGIPQRAHARPRRRPLPRPIRHAQGAHRAGKEGRHLT